MSNITKQLAKLNVSKLKMKNGRTVTDELKYHARILADCIMEELDDVYDSYTPKVWQRDYSLYNSLYIDDFVEIKTSARGVEMSISLHFDDGAFHRSFDGRSVNTAVLIHEGWDWKSNVDIPYLSHREGTHFIEKGIAKYKAKVSKPFKVRLTINDEIRM